MELSVLGCALNVTKAKISYDIDGTNLEGFYAIEFNNPSEGTGISCEKFNVNLPYVTRATLTNEDSKSTVFDIFPQEDPTALVPEGKASFVIKGKTIPAGNHSFCIYFKRKVDEKGEHIVCQFKKSRSAPLLVKINLNNATLDPDLLVDTSGEWVPVRGNLVHIIIMKNDSNPSDSDNTTVTEESPQDDQNDTPATNPDPTPTPDPAPATDTPTPEETPEEPVATTTPDVTETPAEPTETPAEPTESKVDERPSEEKSVTEETNEAQKSEEVQETTPEIESVTESEKVVAQTESVNEPDQEREVDSGSAAANDVAGSEEQPGSEVAETSSEEDEEEEDEGEDEEESEDDEEGADADAKKSHTYSAEDLLQFRKHPDCAKEPESLVNSDIPILIKNAKKLGGNQQHKKGKGRGPKKPRRQGKGRGGKGPQVQLKEVKPLEKSENRWKPSALIQVELTAEEKALKTANSILNKLAMENFEPLSAQLVECLTEDSKGDEVLKGIITLIYDKALEQPKFVVLYARLCAVVRRNEKDNSFMQLLAQKAKTEFLTITKANIGEKADYSEEERNYLIKLRYLGNIQFICELYKLKLLNNTVPLRCADGLLKQSNDFISEEDSIEALCKMLKALGARLKHSNAQTLNTIMMQLNEKKESMSSRIRFMIQDIVELHKHNWEKPQAKRTPLRHSKSKITSSSPNVPTSTSPKDTWNTVGKSKTKGTSKGGNGPRGTPIRSSWGSVNTPKPSKETPPPTPPPEVKAKEPEPTGPTLSTCTKLNNTTKNILEEYYELRDLEEVNACVKELYDSMKELNIKPDNFLPTFVHSALCSISKEAQIKPIEELLVYLFKQELIKAAQVLEGFLLIYQSIEDKAEEFPNLPKFLGALYGTLLAENVIEVSALKEMGQTVEDRNVTAKFCGAALCRFFKDSDEETILNALKEAGVSLVDVTRKLPEERLGRHFPNETVLKAVLQLPN